MEKLSGKGAVNDRWRTEKVVPGEGRLGFHMGWVPITHVGCMFSCVAAVPQSQAHAISSCAFPPLAARWAVFHGCS